VIIKDDADYKCEIQLRTIIYDSVAKLIHPSYKEGNLTDKDKELLEAARIKQSEIDSKDYNIKDINSNETIAPPILSPKEHAYYISLLNPLPLPEAQAAQLVVTVMIELPPELVSLVERHSPTYRHYKHLCSKAKEKIDCLELALESDGDAVEHFLSTFKKEIKKIELSNRLKMAVYLSPTYNKYNDSLKDSSRNVFEFLPKLHNYSDRVIISYLKKIQLEPLGKQEEFDIFASFLKELYNSRVVNKDLETAIANFLTSFSLRGAAYQEKPDYFKQLNNWLKTFREDSKGNLKKFLNKLKYKSILGMLEYLSQRLYKMGDLESAAYSSLTNSHHLNTHHET